MIEIKTEFVTIPYKTSVPVRGKLIHSNRFLKVTILEKDYYLSTLDGLHETTLEEVSFKVKEFFSSFELNFSNIDFSVKYFNLTSSLPDYSAEILFHIESLLLGMISKTHPHLFNQDEILVNSLFRPANGLEFYKNSGCIKIKINPENALLTAELLNAFYEQNPLVLFRLDGNRKFELWEMMDFEKTLREKTLHNAFIRIDYVEEPFKNFYDSKVFEAHSELKIAIDESYIHFMEAGILDFPSVIKPSLIGLSPVFLWLGSHKENRAIISTSFEHPTILEGLKFLARTRPFEYHGLENFIEIAE